MPRPGRALAELIVLAMLSFAAYAVLWLLQNSLWSNGLVPHMTSALPRPGTDVLGGLDQSIRVMLLGAAVVGLAAWLVARAGRFAQAGLAWAVVAIPLVIAIGLFVLPPTLSIDAYSYLSHGFLAAAPGSNPYVDPSASVNVTPFGQQLLDNGWQPVHGVTPYGPLWTTIERAAYVLSGGSVAVGIVLIKTPCFLAVLATAVLISRLLSEVAPARRLTGLALFLANPLVLIELVGEGHNDAVMVFFAVLAVYATVRRWGFVAVVAIGLGGMVKPSTLPLGLLVVVALFLWRTSMWRTLLGVLAGAVVAGGAAVALMAPYWVGPSTLSGLFSESVPSVGYSVAGILSGVMSSAHAQTALAVLLVAGTVAACFLVRTVSGFIRACAIVSLLILLLLPLEWPWYAALACAMLALHAEELDIVAALLLALGSRVIAPIGDANAIGAMGWQLFATTQALIGQGVPGAVGLWATVSRAVANRDWRKASAAEKGLVSAGL